MQSLIKQACPLCGGEAVYVLIDHDDKKYFKCPMCIKFVVSVGEDELLRNSPTEWKKQMSDISKSLGDDKALSIMRATDLTKNQVSQVFQVEVVLRSTLPQ